MTVTIESDLHTVLHAAESHRLSVLRASSKRTWLVAPSKFSTFGGWSTKGQLFELSLIAIEIRLPAQSASLQLRIGHPDLWRFALGIIVPLAFITLITERLLSAYRHQASSALLAILILVMLPLWFALAILLWKIVRSYVEQRRVLVAFLRSMNTQFSKPSAPQC